MRMRSTGLGKTELEAEIVEIKRVDDCLLMDIRTTRPVKWRVRMVFQQRDMRALVSAGLRLRNLKYVVRSLLRDENDVPKSDTF